MRRLARWMALGVVAGATLPALPAHGQIVAAGADEFTGAGVVDGWTNVLYINEGNPLSFFGTGQDHGVLTTVNVWVSELRAEQSMFTPFVAEPLVPDPLSGDDFVIRAIGTTREAGVDWQCGGEYAFAFSDTEQFTVQEGWVVGFLTADPLSERADALSPIPFIPSAGVDGWLTGSGGPGTGLPVIELNQTIVQGGSGTDADAYGFREYQFQIRAAAGDTQPPLGPLGKVGDACPVPAGGNVAGTHPLVMSGGPDGWTNVLYINEERPFDFSEYGADEGTLNEFNFIVAPGRESLGMVTPFVVEPLVDNPATGADFVVRAIGTTREAGTDWNEAGEHSFPFSDTDEFTVQSGWLVGFLSSDPLSESDLAASPIPFDSNAAVDGWLTGSATPATGLPVLELNEPIIEGGSGTNADAFGFRRYYFNLSATPGAGGIPGDFDGNGLLDAADIDQLSREVAEATNTKKFDLNGDNLVDPNDRRVWVEQLKHTYFGDANLDGEFSSADLVHVFQRGKYEDAVENNASWDDGDWDGDQDFTSSDFVIAFQGAGYEQGPRAAVQAVPEPSSWLLALLGMLPWCRRRRHRATDF